MVVVAVVVVVVAATVERGGAAKRGKAVVVERRRRRRSGDIVVVKVKGEGEHDGAAKEGRGEAGRLLVSLYLHLVQSSLSGSQGRGPATQP